ncbi:MAG: transcription antitermination factor NusB [Gammaproteobacteria bacterium]|nr:transcription antitermination factor NusB [Gammaproteobacteria bacterium]
MSNQSQQRRQSRRRALQALYQWDIADGDVRDIDAQFLATQDMSKADVGYFQELLHAIPAELSEIDASLQGCLDRELSRLDPIERNVLRIATHELRARHDIPYRVIINEAVELTKIFGAEQGHKYVNGVLDAVAQQLRSNETAAQINAGS